MISWISDPSVSGKKLEAAERINDAFEKNATHLKLSSLRLSTLPPCIGRLKKLEHLDLDSNALETLPEEIGQLVKLKFLDLNINKLKFLPEEMGELTALIDLSFNYNRNLQHLPLSLGNIPQLTSICHGASGVSDTERNAILHRCQSLATQETKDASYGKELLFSQRPLEVEEEIDRVYKSLENATWMHAGNWGSYGLLNFKDCDVIAQRIANASPRKKDLYFLDLGAGNFTWVDEVSGFLRSNYSDNEHHFHVIGVTGEMELSDEKREYGNVTTHKVCGFKLENLLESFAQQGLQLLDSVEFIVASWTLRHLVDPIGTLDQAYHLLTWGNGFLFGTGFYDPFLGRKYSLGSTLSHAFGMHNYIARKSYGNELDAFALFRPKEYEHSEARAGFSYDYADPIIKFDKERMDCFAKCSASLTPKKWHDDLNTEFGGGFYGSGTYVLEQLLGYGEKRFKYKKNTFLNAELFDNLRHLRLYLESPTFSGTAFKTGRFDEKEVTSRRY